MYQKKKKKRKNINEVLGNADPQLISIRQAVRIGITFRYESNINEYQ